MKNHYVYALLDPRKPGKYSYPCLGEVLEFTHEPFYVGKGQGKRISHHMRDAVSGKNPSSHKENRIRDIIVDGYIPIEVKMWQSICDEDALKIEILVISIIGRRAGGSGPLTNISLGGDGVSGVAKSAEHKEKLRKPKTEAHKNKLRNANLGKVHTQETRDKLSAIGKGRPHSEDHSKKIGDALKGRVFSEETRKKMSLAKKGRKPGNPGMDAYSPEANEKRSFSMSGRKHSDETKGKISAARMGKSHSQETREKMSAAKKGRSASGACYEAAKATNTGRKHSPETRLKMRESMSGISHVYSDEGRARKQESDFAMMQCPHCKKEGKAIGMRRWHFDRCKEKK